MRTPWYRVATSLGMLGLGVTACGGWVLSLVDEAGDNRAIESLSEQGERADYELSCRYDQAQPVAQIEGQQFDALVALAITAPSDEARQRLLTARLEQLAVAKSVALVERAQAVRECDEKADRLYGP